MKELVAGGALVRSGDGRYHIGRRMWDLGLLAPAETDLRELASPYLHDIHAATRATVHLAIREEHAVLYLDRLSGQGSVPVVSRVGARLPLHTTGVGKVLLAHAPADVVDTVMHALTPATPYSITAPGVLGRELDRIRTTGYATTHEEMTLGGCSVAVPVRVGDQSVAAIGVVVPELKRSRSRLVTALTIAARGIARELVRMPEPVGP